MTSETRQACVDVLQQIADNPAMIDADEQIKGLITKIYRTQRKTSRRAEGVIHREADRALRQSTVLVRRDTVNAILASGASGQDIVGVLRRESICYACKQPYQGVHFFYHRLCPACAAFHYAKRSQTSDLTGRIAVVTGGRVKIGFQLALRLLRDGARVIVTTRFAGDAECRFRVESDYAAWADRLVIVALDLRDLRAVEAFTDGLLANEPYLDILVNNAAQTVKRPLAFYQHLLDVESSPPVLMEARQRWAAPVGTAFLSAMGAKVGDCGGTGDPLSTYFPAGALDADGQQIDARPVHSWRLRLHEVELQETVEVQLVNAIAPFLLCGRLKNAFLRSPHARRFVVNVSAMEGQFTRESKTVYHPHTNMAKAALNMLTRTSAADYVRDGIYMNSVDTGWITDENPLPRQARYRTTTATDFHPPLDVIDGMARIYDPIARGVNEPNTEPLFGRFLKDYAPYAW